MQKYQNEGELVSPLLIGQEVVLFRFHDNVRPFVKTPYQISKMGLKLVMLTGDHAFSAERIAHEMGIPISLQILNQRTNSLTFPAWLKKKV